MIVAVAGTAMVTGASSGIGRAYALALAARGWDLVLVARRTERLDRLAEEVTASRGVRAEVLTADLARPSDRERVAERAARGLGMLVNDAGFGAFGTFPELDPGVARDLVGVHVLATLELSRAAVPAMLNSGRGAIVNLASGLAWSGSLPRDARPRRVSIAYAAAKAFVVTFTRGLAQDLAGTGVGVQVLCPSVTATEFHGGPAAPGAMRADDVVAASLEGLRLGEVICLPGLEDVDLPERLGAVELELLGANSGPVLAQRYRQNAPISVP